MPLCVVFISRTKENNITPYYLLYRTSKIQLVELRKTQNKDKVHRIIPYCHDCLYLVCDYLYSVWL